MMVYVIVEEQMGGYKSVIQAYSSETKALACLPKSSEIVSYDIEGPFEVDAELQ